MSTAKLHLRAGAAVAALTIWLAGCATGLPPASTPSGGGPFLTAAAFTQSANIVDGNAAAAAASAAECQSIALTCKEARTFCAAAQTAADDAAFYSESTSRDRENVAIAQRRLDVAGRMQSAFSGLDPSSPSASPELVAGFAALDGIVGNRPTGRSMREILLTAQTEAAALMALEEPLRAAVRTVADLADEAEDIRSDSHNYRWGAIDPSAPADGGYGIDRWDSIVVLTRGFPTSSDIAEFESGFARYQSELYGYLSSPGWFSDRMLDVPYNELSNAEQRAFNDGLDRLNRAAIAAGGLSNRAIRLNEGLQGPIAEEADRLERWANRAARSADSSQIARGEAQRNTILAAQACSVDTPAKFTELPLETPFDQWIDVPAASNTFWDWSSP